MTSHVFFDSNHDLRSGWAFALFVIVLFAAFFAFAITASMVVPVFLLQDETLALAVNATITLLSAFAATIFMARFIDHRPLSTFGVSLHRWWSRDFLVGIAVAAVMLTILLVLSFTLAETTIERSTGWPVIIIIATAALLVQAAAFEEIVFRGYPFQTLMRGMGTWPAVIIMSVLFGLVHANNPNASALGIMNTIVAGIVLSIAYLKTRSLWFPYGIHLGWNAGLGMVLGFSLSGVNIATFWTTRVTGPDVLVGGGYGPEGGIIGTVAFVSGAGCLRWWRSRHKQEEIETQ